MTFFFIYEKLFSDVDQHFLKESKMHFKLNFLLNSAQAKALAKPGEAEAEMALNSLVVVVGCGTGQ